MGDETYTGIRLDERAVRVLAHPLRSRLLGRLRVTGPATATELAALLQTNTGATSYHLRALESVGLVTDTGEGVGKRRLWRATTQSHSWTNSDFGHDEDARTALDWLQRDYLRQFATRAEHWQDVAGSWPAEWVDVLGLNDTFIEVTPEQAGTMRDELDALLDRYRALGAGDPRARRIHVYTHTSPLEPDAPPHEHTAGESDAPPHAMQAREVAGGQPGDVPQQRPAGESDAAVHAMQAREAAGSESGEVPQQRPAGESDAAGSAMQAREVAGSESGEVPQQRPAGESGAAGRGGQAREVAGSEPGEAPRELRGGADGDGA